MLEANTLQEFDFCCALLTYKNKYAWVIPLEDKKVLELPELPVVNQDSEFFNKSMKL